MPHERLGMHRTAWAAGWSDRPVHTGETRAEVENAALDALSELLDAGFLEPEDLSAEELIVYRDVLWCLGPEAGDYCSCGGPHLDDEAPWSMMSYVERHKGRISWPAADQTIAALWGGP